MCVYFLTSIGMELLYNVVLLSTVKQSKSATPYIYLLFWMDYICLKNRNDVIEL